MQRCSLFLLAILAALVTNSAPATAIYVIDPAQSYVSAYVTEWTAYSYTPPYWTGRNAPPPPDPTVVWALNWSLDTFQLSGYFQATSEISPYDPAWAHLAITNQHLQNQLPSYLTQSFVLPGQLTYSVSAGGITYSNFCYGDPFYLYPGLQSGACFTTGPPASQAGTFDGGTLDLTGYSGGYPPSNRAAFGADLSQQLVDPGPPPLLDPGEYPASWQSYRIVANAVPAPRTLWLVLIGGCALIRRSTRYSSL
jgi:hypothetical protein